MREMRGQTAVRGVRHVLKSVDGGPTTVDVGDGRTTPVVSSVVINDYAGHPFQIDLSRELASRQVRVDHAYCDTNVTPRADLSDEVAELQIVGISTGKGFDKYDAKKRLVAEIRYGIASARLLVARRPHVTLNSNVPVISLAIVTAVAKALRIKNVLWLQDFQAGLIAMVLGSKRHPIYRAMAWLENWCIRAADHVVTISDGFERETIALGRDARSVTTIPNWAPIDELPIMDRDNDWAKAQRLVGRTVYLYSGTLGMKHRPEALLELSRRLASADPEAVVVVISESVGAEWLENQRTQAEPLKNLRILPFQPFEELPSVLASADVLLCLLERDAGEFSVPSKVLTYLCAGRSVLGLMPANNAATRLVTVDARAGLVAEDLDDFLVHAEALASHREIRKTYGENARKYAESTFAVEAIADQFVDVLNRSNRSEYQAIQIDETIDIDSSQTLTHQQELEDQEAA